MGSVTPITKHEKYIPARVKARTYYLIDPNLDDTARSLYEFLFGEAKVWHCMAYLEWPTTDDALNNIYRSSWGKDLQMTVIRSAFATLRKNRYLRFQYESVLTARILELMEFVGERA